MTGFVSASYIPQVEAMMNGRQTIKLIGGGGVVAASAIGGFAMTRTPDDALVPWQSRKYKDIKAVRPVLCCSCSQST